MGAITSRDGKQGGGDPLDARLSDPRIRDGLAHLLDRIDALEQAIDRLSVAMQQGPGMVAMVADMADEQIGRAAQRGVYFDDRLQNTLHLLEKLTADETVKQLEGLLDLAQRAPGLTAMMADMADDAVRQAAARGVHLDERLHNVLHLLEKLTEDATVKQLENLLELSKQAPGLMAMLGDMADDAVRQAAQNGVDMDARLRNGLHALERLTADSTIEQLDSLLTLAERAPGIIAMTADVADEAMAKAQAEGLDPQAVGEMLKATTVALSKARELPPKKVGLFGLMGALKDPDRQKALGFLMNFLKELGKRV